jgi:hypothetical protein
MILMISTAGITEDVVRPDKSTPDALIKEMAATPQTPTATLFVSPHPDPLLVTSIPPSVPHPPSFSVQQLGDFLEISSLTSTVVPHPLRFLTAP